MLNFSFSSQSHPSLPSPHPYPQSLILYISSQPAWADLMAISALTADVLPASALTALLLFSLSARLLGGSFWNQPIILIYCVSLCFSSASLWPDSSQPLCASLWLLNGLCVFFDSLWNMRKGFNNSIIINIRIFLLNIAPHQTVSPHPAKQRLGLNAPLQAQPLLYQAPSLRYLLKLMVCLYWCTYTHAALAIC